MSEKWNGSIISVDCGSILGVLEGEISSIDIDNQTISLINVSRNSVKCLVPLITLSTNDIKSLKLLKSSVSKEDTTTSLNNSSDMSTFVPTAASNKECANSPLQDDSQKKRGSSKKKVTKISDNKKLQKERDEACFNAPVDSELLDTEFDFEKNLALFDKQKVFDEINALSKPDHIKLVDCNKRGGTAKYRHDENILSSFVPVSRQISVPCKIEKEYVTDSGLTVPSVTVDFKRLLFKRAEDEGFSLKCRLEMIGRAASELALQLLGGNHRLNPQNTHQRPTTVILSGSGIQGAQGINCGRHLANHNVNVSVLTRILKKGPHCLFSDELDLFQLTDGKIVESTRDLPQTVDIIIDALSLHDQNKNIGEDWHHVAREWASTKSKATLIYLDPPPNCKCEEKNIILAPALPFPFENEKCSLNICDIGVPQGIFSNLGCSYSSPFGSKFIVTLYPKKDVV